MDRKSPIFEQTYKDYLAKIAKTDLQAKAPLLGMTIEGDTAILPFLGREYRISPQGILNPEGWRPDFSLCVLLCQHILLSPNRMPIGDDDWVTFKDFHEAAPFVGAFDLNVQRSLAAHFIGKVDQLQQACEQLGGTDPQMGLSYQVVMRFSALPRVPVIILFNDADEEFPAECSILFERRVRHFLDMECLAIVGWLIGDLLKIKQGGSPSLM